MVEGEGKYDFHERANERDSSLPCMSRSNELIYENCYHLLFDNKMNRIININVMASAVGYYELLENVNRNFDGICYLLSSVLWRILLAST